LFSFLLFFDKKIETTLLIENKKRQRVNDFEVLVKGYEIFFRESDTAQVNDFCIKTKEDPQV
jgi:hypothetical protein